MKVIIIEGPDNTGKDTIINNIIENSRNCRIVHCSGPKMKSDDGGASEQYDTFTSLARLCVTDNFAINVKQDFVIFNRYYQGEYVYGQIYRNRDANDIRKTIDACEYILNDNEIDVYYIQLLSSSTKLLVKNDDDKSLSNAEETKIEREIVLFREVFALSNIKKKKLVYVNDGDNFRSRESIWNDIKEFIGV